MARGTTAGSGPPRDRSACRAPLAFVVGVGDDRRSVGDIVRPDLDGDLPLSVVNRAPAAEGPAALLDWYATHREAMEEGLLRHGALLFRGFGIDTEARLTGVARALGGETLDYVDGN